MQVTVEREGKKPLVARFGGIPLKRQKGVVLIRNPNYHASRPAHFGRIELAVGISARRAASDIAAGTADYTEIGTGTTLASRLDAR